MIHLLFVPYIIYVTCYIRSATKVRLIYQSFYFQPIDILSQHSYEGLVYITLKHENMYEKNKSKVHTLFFPHHLIQRMSDDKSNMNECSK